MVYERVSFNVDLVKKMSLQEFVNHKSYQHLWPKETVEVRKERLKEFYNLVNGNSRKPSSKSAKSKSELPNTVVTNRQQ